MRSGGRDGGEDAATGDTLSSDEGEEMIRDLISVVAALIEEVGGCPPHVSKAWERVCEWKPAVIELTDEEFEEIQNAKEKSDD